MNEKKLFAFITFLSIRDSISCFDLIQNFHRFQLTFGFLNFDLDTGIISKFGFLEGMYSEPSHGFGTLFQYWECIPSGP